MKAMRRTTRSAPVIFFGRVSLILSWLLLALLDSAAISIPVTHQWPVGGQNLSNTRSQPFESAIGSSNVSQLVVKWVFTTRGHVSVTPAVVSGVVYFPDQSGNFYALDTSNGALIWSHTISEWTGIQGDWARDDPVFNGGALFLGDQAGRHATYSNGQLSGAGARVMAVNATTGSRLWVTLVDSFPAASITSSPVVFNGTVYVGVSSPTEEDLSGRFPDYPCCSFRGSVVALNARTGQLLWKTNYMPSRPSNPGGYSGGGMWGSTPVVDSKRGSLYVATGNNYEVPQDVETCIADAQASGAPDSVCNSVNNYAQDYFDSVLALDLNSGAIKWADRVEGYDAWNGACAYLLSECPSPSGTDYDFGAGPNLFSAVIKGTTQDVLGIGQKSGIYWALNPDSGNLLWNTSVGPGSGLGGIEWGTAVGQKVYVPISDASQVSYTLQPSGTSANGGSWSALDLATGKILWQTATPGTCTGPFGTTGGCIALGPASVANGVLYVGSMDSNTNDPTMFGLNAATGRILWSFAAGSAVNAGPAIVGNTVYWGSTNKLFAFTVPGT
jgi:polyvinyl alcohol dehydrogenase (cytochrome)